MDPRDGTWRSIWFTARDGIRLHARHYGAPPTENRRPVLCLPGLTRNARDFHDLAMALSTGASPRPVYALDIRGRGLSDHDKDWKNYIVPIEMLDVLDFITLTGLAGTSIVGTSRGGLIAMVMAAAQPTAFGPVVLNDIGPVIDPHGLTRISGYAGRSPLPDTWPEATLYVKSMSKAAFPNVTDAQWDEVARQWFNEKDGRPAPGYDPKISRTLSAKDGNIPELWPQFYALKRKPILVLRGANSDILSQETVQAMCSRHPACQAFTVPDQGHAPLLKDTQTQQAVAAFLNETDAI